jgi:tetratricopeptide (TPR) repeat protein
MRAGIATVICAAALLAASGARAQSSAADNAQAHFDRGAKLYNLGHFQEAITDFEKAYDLDPSPIFLFNIAQSHRQLGNKERALFFYRRYLEQAPNAANRDDVERRMKDLQSSLQQEQELKQKPPTEVSSHVETKDATGTGSPPTTPPDASGGPPGTVVTTPPAASSGERPWELSVGLAPAFASMSGSQVSLPTMVTARLEGAYAFALPAGQLAVGIDLGYARLPYTRQATSTHPALEGTSGSSAFWALLASARYFYGVTPDLKLGGGIEGGYLFWSGLDEGNPFTAQGVAPSGAIALPTVAVNLRAEYRLLDALFVALTPEYLWSEIPSSAGNAVAGVISSISRFDIVASVGTTF